MTAETVPHAALSGAAGDRCPACMAPVTRSWLTCASCGTRLSTPAELDAGDTVGGDRYEVAGVIGRGGFGITYEAVDRRLHRGVAVKELFPETAVRHGRVVLLPPEGREGFVAARARFMREARVLARFSNPGIVRVFEVFEEYGTAYLVLELLRGRTLAEMQRQREGPLAEGEVLDLAARIGDALGAIHRAGLLHRDVSPSNIMLTGDDRAVLIDFGLARAFESGRTAAMTRMVTPGYAPPEQYRGSGRFGPATDVYALAATCYRLLTGEAPVSALDREAGVSLAPPRRINPAVSRLVSDAVLDGLELEVGHRPDSIDAFLARLGIDRSGRDRVLSLPRGAPTGPPLPPAPPWPSSDAPVRAPDLDGPVRPAGSDGARRTVVAVATARAPAAPPDAWVSPPPHPGPAAALGGGGGGSDLGWAVVGPAGHAPAAVAAPRRRRWMATVPLGAVATAAVAALPLAGLAFVAVVALPALATAGDLSVRSRLPRSRWARAAIGGAATVRFSRNAVLGLLRAVPAAVVVGIVVITCSALPDRDSTEGWIRGLLRLGGACAGVLLVAPGLRGTERFRTWAGVDRVLVRLVPGRRFSVPVAVLWLVCTGLTAALLVFNPDPFPVSI